MNNKKSNVNKANRNYSKFENLTKKLNGKIESINKSGHFERYIITDKYEISLPGGFDQFDERGKPFIEGKNRILKMIVERRS